MIHILQRTLSVALVALALVGCTNARYRIVEPEQYAGVIGRDVTTLSLDPLMYRMQEREDRLVVSIENPTDEPIRVIGDDSYIVDPEGQTRPIDEGVIAPRSFVRFVLPPTVWAYRARPAFTMGFGAAHAHAARWSYGGYFNDPYYWPPYASYGPYPLTVNWDWDEGQIRLHLAYSRDGDQFEHEFVIVREEIDK